MVYKRDGSPFRISIGKIIPTILNYGWLSSVVPFTKPKEKQDYKIFKDLADSVQLEITRGHHICEFCDWDNFNYGNGEIWIKIDQTVYIFPRMIWHYVEEHEYGLPIEIYKQIISDKFEKLTEDFIKDIYKKGAELSFDVVYLACQAKWMKERYENMGEFFNVNGWKWNFSQASIEDGFYSIEIEGVPGHLNILFESDPNNFPDEIFLKLINKPK